MLNVSDSGHPVFRGSSTLERENLTSKGKGKLSVPSVVTTTQPNWFLAQSFPSISSVSAEQSRTCATNWPTESMVVQNVQGNLLLRTIQRLF